MPSSVPVLDDNQGMSRALALASQGLFTTTPNPRVGCVLVKQGHVIGEGYTQPAGQAHAEIEALNDASKRGMEVQGATAYVTLEPCSHHGRTPPCADALIRAGLARVVVAIVDPNPVVAGQGLAKLQAAGIEVVCGVHEQAAYEMNIGFFSRMQRGRPWVRIKAAASLDGKTALHNGHSQWITSEASRADGHAWRARACAVLTGIGTVVQDDAQLTVRAVDTPRQPQRIVLDSKLQISPKARILASGGVWIVAAQSNPPQEARLRDAGAEILWMPNQYGQVDLSLLMQELGRRQINELHVEAGPTLHGALIREQYADELLLYLAPNLLGQAQDLFALGRLDALDDKYALSFHEVSQIDTDLRIRARFTDR